MHGKTNMSIGFAFYLNEFLNIEFTIPHKNTNAI